MKAAVYHGPRDIRVETVPDPTIKHPGVRGDGRTLDLLEVSAL
jgi:hypothetical protein